MSDEDNDVIFRRAPGPRDSEGGPDVEDVHAFRSRPMVGDPSQEEVVIELPKAATLMAGFSGRLIGKQFVSGPDRDRWEYDVWTITHERRTNDQNRKDMVAEMNRRGAEGWELVAMHEVYEPSEHTRAVFKRKLP